MKILTFHIEVPNDFDTTPIITNLETDLEILISCNDSDDSLHCKTLQYTYLETQI